MRRRGAVHRRVALIGLCVLLGRAELARADLAKRSVPSAPLAREMPAGALVYVETHRLGDVMERLGAVDPEQWGLTDYWGRFAPGGPPIKQVKAAFEVAKAQLGMDVFKALGKLLADRAALGFYPKIGKQIPDVLLVFRTSDAATLTEFWNRAKALATLALGDRVEETATSAGGARLAIAEYFFAERQGGTVWIASGKDLLDRAIRLKSDPKGASMLVGSAFKNAAQNFGIDHHAQFFVSTTLLKLAMGGRISPAKVDNALIPVVFGGTVELANRGSIIGGSIDVEDRRMIVRLMQDASPAAISKATPVYLPSTEGAGAPPLPQVPGRIAAFSFHRDLAALYKQRTTLLTPETLAAFNRVEVGLSSLVPGRSFSEDIIGSLGTRITMVAARPDFTGFAGEPAIKLPAFALVLDPSNLDAATDIATLLFQTTITVINSQARDRASEPMVLSFEPHQGTTVAYGRHLRWPASKDLPIDYNFSPAIARVGSRLVVSSTRTLAKQLVDFHASPAASRGLPAVNGELTLDPPELAKALRLNQSLLAATLMQRGSTKEDADKDLSLGFKILEAIKKVDYSSAIGGGKQELRLEVGW